MSAEYGTVHTQDEETPLVSRDIEHVTLKQKVQRFFRAHHLHIARGWLIVAAIAVVLTITFHFALKHKNEPHVPETPKEGDENLDMQCVSERSWFVALMLSIFLGPFGKCKKKRKKFRAVFFNCLPK